MGAPLGNRFWEKRVTLQESQLTTDPEVLWQAACEYFAWCEDNPLKETVFVGKEGREEDVNKMRAMTIQGLCLYLDISDQTFMDLERKPSHLGIITRIRRTIFAQKFEGAAAGLLNANIISRELGLAEKTDNSHKIKLGKEFDFNYE